MLPFLFYSLCALAVTGSEALPARVAAIDQKARMYPPKRSPWYGNTDASMKVTLWNANGTMPPQKMRVDATLLGGRARDTYWFDAGKASYGTQLRWSNGEATERRLTFTAGQLTAAQERHSKQEAALARMAFQTVTRDELAKLRASVTSLLQECLKAPGLRDRKATVKSVESDRVVLQTAPGVEAWLLRRSGDQVEKTLVGRPVTYDFTSVEQDGEEQDYLNALQPAGKAAPARATLASAAPAPVNAVAAGPEAPVVKKAVTSKKKTATRKTVRKKALPRKTAP